MATKQFVWLVLVLAILLMIALGCFKFGAEFCPPTVIVPNEGTTVTIAPKGLAHDAAAEVRDAGAAQ